MDNIIENNLLIARFMSGLLNEECRLSLDKNEIWLTFDGVCYYHTIELGRDKILKYHKSWDWLIPVCQKCEELATNNHTIIHWIRNNHTLFDLKLTAVKIELVYKKVLEFINWYNSNNKNF